MDGYAYVKFLEGLSMGQKVRVPLTKVKHKFKKLCDYDKKKNVSFKM